MSSNLDQVILRLMTQLKNLQQRYIGSAIGYALKQIIESIEKDQDNVQVYDILSVTYNFEVGPAAQLSYFYCPQCKGLYSEREAKRDDKGFYACPSCSYKLVQAYTGVPMPTALNPPNSLLLQYFISQPQKQASEYYIAGVDAILSIRCPHISHRNKLKGLVSSNPQRPLQTLKFYCPFSEKDCEFFDNGFCKHGDSDIVVFPPLRGGIRRIVSKPSADITRPLSVTVYTQLLETHDVNIQSARDNISKVIPSIESMAYGSFIIFDFTIMYLMGSAYTSRYHRLPVVVVNPNTGQIIFLVRKLNTKGILLRFNWSTLQGIKDEIKQRYGRSIDEFEIVHSISHILLFSLTRLTGLSPIEFSESIFIDRDNKVAELLIYDNSPQGIGGVKAAVSDTGIADFINYICSFSSPCPRACRSACRACLFYDTCPYLNIGLSWRVSNLAVAKANCI